MKREARRDVVVIVGLFLGVSLMTVGLIRWLGYDLSTLATHLIVSESDSYLNAWTLYQALDNLLNRPFDLGYAPIFYPSPEAFTYTIAPYGIAVFMLPLYLAAKQNLILTYNVYLILTFPLTASTAYIFVRYLLKTGWIAGILAGLLVTFAQMRVPHLAHIETLSLHWLLLCLIALHCLIDRPSPGRMLLLSASVFFCVLTSGYFGLLFIVSALGIVGYIGVRYRQRIGARQIGYLLGAALLSTLMMLPFLLPRLANPALEVGDDLLAVVNRSASLRRWLLGDSMLYAAINRRSTHRPLYPGTIILLLALAAPIALRRLRGATGGHKDDDVLPDRLLSTGDVIVLYGMLGLVGVFLSFGPIIYFSVDYLGFGIPSPYLLLMRLPVFGQIRDPGRLGFIVVITLALFAAFSVDYALKHITHQTWRIVFMVGLTAGLIIEMFPRSDLLDHSPPPDPDPVYEWLATRPPGTVLAYYPSDKAAIVRILSYQSVHHQPTINGAGSYLPLDYPDYWYGWGHRDYLPVDPAELENIRQRGAQYLVIQYRYLDAQESKKLNAALMYYNATHDPDLESVAEFPHSAVYRIPAAPLD